MTTETMGIDYALMERDNIRSLDQAMYVASTFAGSSDDKRVTVLQRIEGDEEVYRVVDGKVGPMRDNDTGHDWWPVYYLERAPEWVRRDK